MLDLHGLHIRAALLRLLREFFFERGFLEVDTPVRQPVIIPEQYIEPITAEGQFLQTSPELCMKRILAAGADTIFQICPCFRKGERGRRHLEEFTMLEWYRRGEDYCSLMADCEDLLRFVVLGLPAFEAEKKFETRRLAHIDFSKFLEPAEHITVEEAFNRFSPVPMARALEQDLFDEIVVEHIEPKLGIGKPTFLTDYPVQLASLAKVSADNPQVAERFELYIDGIELANGFTELTDADEQRTRFLAEQAAIKNDQGRQQEIPERFLNDLNQLADAAGIAFGLDRLLMLLTGSDTIQSVVTFAPDDMI
ncbi:EF-P lysine aminoacylase EpmA [Desulfosediminicola ganghwensis]|uniref:EF-P lysine aminoacylase EpmA n=1 Tax=Desulfosediminicola ganghwensis TaxID=2569540 RepID=UPI0010AC4958|nr:EF-P lysine aminoacylase EpmA [Desulfosediminicola ganghwensis]